MPDWIEQLRQRQDAYGNSAERWVIALAIFAGILLLLKIIKSVLGRRISTLAERAGGRWPTMVRGLVERTKLFFLVVLAAYCASLTLKLPPDIERVVQSVTVISLLLQSAIWANSLLNLSVEHYARERITTDAASVTTVSVLGFLGKVALWAVVVLVALDNVGVNVTALVAGLGIGGIAVALAAQNILGDLFASISIMLDRPFVLGDSITVGDFSGNVEHIGIKTTRIRSVSGEQIVFSNNDLLQSRLRNNQRMKERRVLFTLNVTYQTTRAALTQIPLLLQEIIETQDSVRFDRAHFKTFGESALIFEAVYFVLTSDYKKYMDIQQAVNLAICERFAQKQIDFACPTRAVFVEGLSAHPRASVHSERNSP